MNTISRIAVVIGGIALLGAGAYFTLGVARGAGDASSGDTKVTPAAIQSTPVDATTEPHTEDVLFVVKEEAPFILMDMAPELPHMAPLGDGGVRQYLMKRAAMTVIQDGAGREDYEGMDRFVVRMIVLTERDEYGRPQWGGAPELARFEIQRDAVATLAASAVNGMDGTGIEALIADARFDLTHLER